MFSSALHSLGWIKFHCVYIPHFIMYSSSNEHLGWLRFLAIVSRAAMSRHVKASWKPDPSSASNSQAVVQEPCMREGRARSLTSLCIHLSNRQHRMCHYHSSLPHLGKALPGRTDKDRHNARLMPLRVRLGSRTQAQISLLILFQRPRNIQEKCGISNIRGILKEK